MQHPALYFKRGSLQEHHNELNSLQYVIHLTEWQQAKQKAVNFGGIFCKSLKMHTVFNFQI